MDTDVDWVLLDFSEPKKADAAKVVPALPLKECPKCGKPLGKGGHFHIKACKADDSARSPR